MKEQKKIIHLFAEAYKVALQQRDAKPICCEFYDDIKSMLVDMVIVGADLICPGENDRVKQLSKVLTELDLMFIYEDVLLRYRQILEAAGEA